MKIYFNIFWIGRVRNNNSFIHWNGWSQIFLLFLNSFEKALWLLSFRKLSELPKKPRLNRVTKVFLKSVVSGLQASVSNNIIDMLNSLYIPFYVLRQLNERSNKLLHYSWCHKYHSGVFLYLCFPLSAVFSLVDPNGKHALLG